MTSARLPQRGFVVLAAALSLIGGVVAGSVSASGASGGRSAPSAPSARETRVVTAHWALLETGADGRSVVIAYVAPLCHVGRARVHVRETRTSIRIAVTQRVIVPAPPARGRPGIACTTEAAQPRRTVHLHSLVAGRRLSGGGHVRGPLVYLTRPGTGTDAELLVPRMLGLAPDQALRALAVQGFHGRLVGSRGREVVAQQPPRGSTAPRGHVELTAGH